MLTFILKSRLAANVFYKPLLINVPECDNETKPTYLKQGHTSLRTAICSEGSFKSHFPSHDKFNLRTCFRYTISKEI